MHTEMDSIDEDRLWKALETYGRFGKPLHLSEISILSCERLATGIASTPGRIKWMLMTPEGRTARRFQAPWS